MPGPVAFHSFPQISQIQISFCSLFPVTFYKLWGFLLAPRKSLPYSLLLLLIFSYTVLTVSRVADCVRSREKQVMNNNCRQVSVLESQKISAV